MNANINQVFANVAYQLERDGNNDEVDEASNNDFITANAEVVNYLPVTLSLPHANLLDEQHHLDYKSKGLSFLQQKELFGASSTSVSNRTDMSLTQVTKYDDYQNAINILSSEVEDQIIDDVISEKSDCESVAQDTKRISSKPAKRSLPHKKRIAKKLNAEQFSLVISSSASLNPMQSTIAQFECTECGLLCSGQLDFFIHLKTHYEPLEILKHNEMSKDQNEECTNANLSTIATQSISDQNESVPENLIIESLDSQDEMKNEEIDGDAFEFSEPEDIEDFRMEDFRKEVEKVVETIGDCNETWNYHQEHHEMQVPVDINDDESQGDASNIQDYSNKMQNENLKIDNFNCTFEAPLIYANDTSNSLPMDCKQNKMYEPVDEKCEEEEEEDDDDNKPLEQVRLALKMDKKVQRQQMSEADKHEIELNECLKKIHNFRCNIENCNKAFNSRTALGYHLKTHNTERKFVCEQCGKKFLTNGALKVHIRLHTNSRPYKCTAENCGKSFRQWGDLKYHETSLHSDKKQFVCEFCAKEFARKYSLVLHRRIHTGERNYKCEVCDKSFRASSYLMSHNRIHTGEKPYSCEVCAKKFRVQGDLKRHMRTHRSKTEAKQEKLNEQAKRVNTEKDVDKKPATETTLKLRKRIKKEKSDFRIITIHSSISNEIIK